MKPENEDRLERFLAEQERHDLPKTVSVIGDTMLRNHQEVMGALDKHDVRISRVESVTAVLQQDKGRHSARIASVDEESRLAVELSLGQLKEIAKGSQEAAKGSQDRHANLTTQLLMLLITAAVTGFFTFILLHK